MCTCKQVVQFLCALSHRQSVAGCLVMSQADGGQWRCWMHAPTEGARHQWSCDATVDVLAARAESLSTTVPPEPSQLC